MAIVDPVALQTAIDSVDCVPAAAGALNVALNALQVGVLAAVLRFVGRNGNGQHPVATRR